MRPTAKEIARLPRRPYAWLLPPGRALMLLVALALVPVPASAHLGAWVNAGCETPSEFYSTARTGARPMCCANQARPSVGVCPGGSPCPATDTARRGTPACR